MPAIEAMPGALKVVRNGSFLRVIAEHQDQAWAVAAALSQAANWDVKNALPTHEGIYGWLESAENVVEAEIVNTAPLGAEAKVVERTYKRPYQMHGSIGPSVAIAASGDDGKMTIHTHSQSAFTTAAAIEELLGMGEGSVRCIHGHGSGWMPMAMS